jgi:hypothetical protein
MPTAVPARARAWAAKRPRPRPPPVTKATLVVSERDLPVEKRVESEEGMA